MKPWSVVAFTKLTRDAAKLQYPNERQMRKAFKKECKEAYKASTHTAAAH
jgi:hypothetical protein